ncbi:MAG: anti-sigma factor [Acetobacteraceae bacterium]
MSDTPEDRDLTVAEYVLGTLDADAAQKLDRAAARDPVLAAAVAAWERRLAPLALLVPPAPPPPELWARIEAAAPRSSPHGIQAKQANLLSRLVRSLEFWRLTTAGAVAVAAVFAGLFFARPAKPPMVMATIAPTHASVPVFVAEMQPNGALLIRALSPVSVAAGKALELWALPPGAKAPVALGMLPPSGMRIETAANLGNATELMISLEPEGGSPTGKPTGPVMYQGRLSRIE